MYFTPQQLSGGPRYNFKTRAGNWFEDWEAHETKLKDYMNKKDCGSLVITKTQQKFAKSSQQVPHTYREDGTLEYQDSLLLQNCLTDGILVCDMSDRVNGCDEAYMVTSTTQKLGAVARSVYSIERANAKSASMDPKVRYGDEVRIRANTYICGKDLYLHSCPISPLAYARFSRNQEVCLHTQKNYNTVWRILPSPGNGYYNEVVKAGVPVILEHCATVQNLSNDHIPYRNDFGNELEVSCKSHATAKKTQILANESKGVQTREGCLKEVGTQNYWTFVLSSEPQMAPAEVAKLRYSGKKMVEDLRKALSDCNMLSIASLIKTFNRIDVNKDGKVSPMELQQGLEVFHIFLNDEQVDALIQDFDKDGSGYVDFFEFSSMLLVSPIFSASTE